jgi:hypothetical protein
LDEYFFVDFLKNDKMNFDSINNLIEKYFVGETSLEEEKILRGYFNGADIDARLNTYKPLFQFFEKEKTIVFADAKMPKLEETKRQITPPKFGILRGGQFWKIAATLAFLVVGSIVIFKTFEQKTPPVTAHRGAKMIILDDDSDPKVALQQVNAALALVSKKMKKGTDQTTNGLLKLRDATSILNKEN